uniref:Uncharacterized protein n=1 Tax=Meloidogyne enterolobii TaxID=390850 RepID=A0A6V7XSE3_MELEN|nr:unnamed protein product [Meloidogyne enterolobii]
MKKSFLFLFLFFVIFQQELTNGVKKREGATANNTPNPELIVEGSLLIRIFSELDIGHVIYSNTDITEYIKGFGNYLILSTFGISNIFDNNPFDKTFNRLKNVIENYKNKVEQINILGNEEKSSDEKCREIMSRLNELTNKVHPNYVKHLIYYLTGFSMETGVLDDMLYISEKLTEQE